MLDFRKHVSNIFVFSCIVLNEKLVEMNERLLPDLNGSTLFLWLQYGFWRIESISLVKLNNLAESIVLCRKNDQLGGYFHFNIAKWCSSSKLNLAARSGDLYSDFRCWIADEFYEIWNSSTFFNHLNCAAWKHMTEVCIPAACANVANVPKKKEKHFAPANILSLISLMISLWHI